MLILKQKIEEFLSINLKVEYPDFDESKTYAFGEVAFYGHYYYKSIVDDNLGLVPEKNPTKWLRWSISNRYASIDLQAQTKTTCDQYSIEPNGSTPYDLVMEFDNNRYDSIAFGDIYGSKLIIEVFKKDGSLYQTITENMKTQRSCVTSWYNYFYCPLAIELDENVKSLFYRIYPIKGKIRVTIKQGVRGYSSLGYMISGNSSFVGDTEFNVGYGVEDYSVKTYDDFGILDLKRRESLQTRDCDVSFDSNRITEVSRLVANTLGKVVLFIIDENQESNYDNILLLGIIDSFDTILSNPVITKASFSLTETI